MNMLLKSLIVVLTAVLQAKIVFMDAGGANEENWKDEVREKLVVVFSKRSEDLCRILFFLDEEDKAYKDNANRPYAPQWKNLKATLKSDEAFQLYAQQLSDEIKTAEKDQKFRIRMNKVHENMLTHSDSPGSLEEYQRLDVNRLHDFDINTKAAFGGLARAWSIIPPESQASLLKVIRTMARSTTMSTAVDDVLRSVDTYGGNRVMVGLSGVHLSFAAYINIKRWWYGEISGKRCVKNLLDATFTAAAGVGGSCAGAALGSMFGPVGTIVGGIVGGWGSAAGVNYLTDILTQNLFELPKEEALENAHRHLGVKMTASNAEVNFAFRQLCLKTHPDKPEGNTEDFFLLQSNMAVIKLARGDF